MYYLSAATKDVVFMDYWRLSERFIPLVCNNELALSDLWMGDWGQRNPLLFGLFCLNIRYLGLNAMVSVCRYNYIMDWMFGCPDLFLATGTLKNSATHNNLYFL